MFINDSEAARGGRGGRKATSSPLSQASFVDGSLLRAILYLD